MSAISQRSARIAGWVLISGGMRTGGTPQLGGLVDISRTGARIYTGWKVAVGDVIPLALRIPGNHGVVRMPGKVVWVRKDESGRLDSFEARLKLMRDLARIGHPPKGMVFGWMCGVRFLPGVPLKIVRLIQMHLEAESDRRPGGAALTMLPPEPGPETQYR